MIENKLVSLSDVQSELTKKGQLHGLTEMALKKVPEAVVRCGKCEFWHPMDEGWGICKECGRVFNFRKADEFCSRGECRTIERK